MQKKTSIVCILAFLLVMTVSSVAGAAIQASEYINCYGAAIYTSSNGNFVIDFEIDGTGTMDMIGAKTILLQERASSNDDWETVKTYSYLDYDNMMAYNARTLSSNVPYNGTVGYYYRAKVYFYAENGGYDTREYITSSVQATSTVTP